MEPVEQSSGEPGGLRLEARARCLDSTGGDLAVDDTEPAVGEQGERGFFGEEMQVTGLVMGTLEPPGAEERLHRELERDMEHRAGGESPYGPQERERVLDMLDHVEEESHLETLGSRVADDVAQLEAEPLGRAWGRQLERVLGDLETDQARTRELVMDRADDRARPAADLADAFRGDPVSPEQ